MRSVPRKISEKATFIASAWEKQAADSKFSNLTLAQYRAQINATSALEKDIVGLERAVAGKREELVSARKGLSKISKSIVNAVRGDADHGSDSPLLASMGYVTDSQRKSGKTNKANGNGNGANEQE
jgi:hypothetical protein